MRFLESRKVRKVDIIEIFRVRNIRDESKLKALSEDLKEAQLSPVILEPLGDGKYRLIAGARRLDAHPYEDVEGKVFEFNDDVERRIIALRENLIREELNVVDLALNFKALNDEGLSYREIALRVYHDEKKEKWIGNLVRLVKSSSEDLLYHLAYKDIGLKVALEVIRLPKGRQEEAIRQILQKALSYEAVKELVNQMLEEDRGDSEVYGSTSFRKARTTFVLPQAQEVLMATCRICKRHVYIERIKLVWVCENCLRG